MDGFRTQFDGLVHNLYILHGADCTYTRPKTQESWSVRLIPHIGEQYLVINRSIGASPLHVFFRSLVTTASTHTAVYGKTASDSFITPIITDEITLNGEVYKVSTCEGAERGWRFLNDRRTQIEICTMKTTRSENH